MRAETLNEFVTLYEADCLDVLSSRKPFSIDAIITDPPYGINYQSCSSRPGKLYGKRFEIIRGDDRPQTEWIGFAANASSPSAPHLCFHEWRNASIFRNAFEDAGMPVRSQIVWDRMSGGMGDIHRAASPRHDLIWLACRKEFRFPGKRPASVYAVPKVPWQASEHPTQKPVELLKRLILDYTKPGDMIVDPFAGSGTTAIAAMETGRHCLAIEIDPTYAQRIRERVRSSSV